MNLDLKLTQLGLRNRHFILVDLSFPDGVFEEFRRSYPDRYLHLPCHSDIAMEFAAGLSSFGNHVYVWGVDEAVNVDLPDKNLNVKFLYPKEGASWDGFEDKLLSFTFGKVYLPM
ncbi:hypothetical protein HOD30_03155 [Candidatus Peregrinibacteria bacterium]|jgi:hypothetical protein|nr:hypothetical protein [Candidatus Peregrinibacteria bacterium]MBT4631694.1 hypothetical protein [Candidatus Peregrinibacteria bacterium]MBT5517215.1 hypothetical protein [Candidatus Peregrinibacteria bacterium]MBT5824243.1 hypothetical protein [Candidatus Peregrinibacteria bacterium]